MIKSLSHKPIPWDQLPCPYCGGKVIYTDNSRIYHGRTYGNGKCFVCTACGLVIPLAVLIYAAAKLLSMDYHGASALWSVNWTDVLIVTLTSFAVEIAVVAFNHTDLGFNNVGFQGLVIGILADIYYNIKTN